MAHMENEIKTIKVIGSNRLIIVDVEDYERILKYTKEHLIQR